MRLKIDKNSVLKIDQIRVRHENPHVTCTLLCTWYTKKAYMVRKKGVHGPVEKNVGGVTVSDWVHYCV